MNDIYQSKYLNKKKKKNEEEKSVVKFLKTGMLKTLLTAFIFLILAIMCKQNQEFKTKLVNHVYGSSLSFSKINEFYDKYLGGVLPFDNPVVDTKPVFSEELTYQDKSKYLDGVKLTVSNEYLVPVLTTGIVVYIGEKEGYGNVIIIQSMDGFDTWYGNIANTSVKLYDYIEKGDLLGSVKDNYLYLVYSKNNEILNYEEYLN